MTGDMMSTQVDNAEVADGHSFANQIGQLVNNKYQELFGATTYSKRRVMAGVVMCKNRDLENTAEVVCVSSGTKCVNGEQLSLKGNKKLNQVLYTLDFEVFWVKIFHILDLFSQES